MLFGFILLGSCKTEPEIVKPEEYYSSDLFIDVQLEAIFEDSKTFTDLVPNTSYKEVMKLYEQQKDKPEFNLEQFVSDNFSDQSLAVLKFETDTTKNMYEHISSIWDKLKRGPDSYNPNSSRIALPKEYIVPGGRFQEIYYWDSYFTLEGLLLDGQEDIALAMVDNFAHLIDSIGFIPNGTRNYYLTRSQPPFFSLMVDAVSRSDSTRVQEYLPQLLKEYAYWMEGEEELEEVYGAINHVILLPDEVILNRYWDRGVTPRPEAYKEDTHLAADLEDEEAKKELYSNLRTGAASGWDFSSRWYKEEGNFASTATAEIIPVDLNSLLYFMEMTIARGYRMNGDLKSESDFLDQALNRKMAIREVLWDEEAQFYGDFNFVEQELTGQYTLAGAYPLYFEIATKKQALAVKEKLISDFLKPGGLVSTLHNTGQQWDAPNGWAPLQWMAVHGLLNYGFQEEASEIMQRWLAVNERVYQNTGKMMEKYNVEDLSLLSGGGEYPTQDGFGWTNGVALGFRDLLQEMEDRNSGN